MSKKSHVQISPNFLCMLLVAVVRSFSDDSVICFVFPVLWMTSYNVANGSESKATRMFRRVLQVAPPGTKLIAVYTIAGLLIFAKL